MAQRASKLSEQDYEKVGLGQAACISMIIAGSVNVANYIKENGLVEKWKEANYSLTKEPNQSYEDALAGRVVSRINYMASKAKKAVDQFVNWNSQVEVRTKTFENLILAIEQLEAGEEVTAYELNDAQKIAYKQNSTTAKKRFAMAIDTVAETSIKLEKEMEEFGVDTNTEFYSVSVNGGKKRGGGTSQFANEISNLDFSDPTSLDAFVNSI